MKPSKLALLLLSLTTYAASQSVQMVSFTPAGVDMYVVKEGVSQDTVTTIHPLPIEQHTTFLRISSSTSDSVNKMVAGLDIRSLPLGADGTTSDAAAAAAAPASASAAAPAVEDLKDLVLDVSKPDTTPTPINQDTPHYEKTVEVTYICGGKPGTYVVLGTIPSDSGADVVVFKWKKTCGKGLIYGFSIATSNNVLAVVNGDVMPSFRGGNGENKESATIKPYRVGYAQDTLHLLLRGPAASPRLINDLPYFSISFNVTNIELIPKDSVRSFLKLLFLTFF